MNNQTDKTVFEVQVDRCDLATWSELLNSFDDATIYQTWSYGAVRWGEQQLSSLVLMRDGAPAAAALMRIVKLPLLSGGMAYLRWGPLIRRRGIPFSRDTLRRMLIALREEYVVRRGLLLRILPNVHEADSDAAVWLGEFEEVGILRNKQRPRYRTMIVNLESDEKEIRARFIQKWRNALNAAERTDELTVIEGTTTDYFDRFLSLYNEMHERKHFDTSIQPSEFWAMQQHLPESQRMLVLLGGYLGRDIAALVASPIGRTGIYLFGATGDEALKLKISNLLQWEMILRLKQRGCHRYDLGGINPEKNPGGYKFKKGLSGVDVQSLGEFELSRSLISAVSVRIGENIKRIRRSVAARE